MEATEKLSEVRHRIRAVEASVQQRRGMVTMLEQQKKIFDTEAENAAEDAARYESACVLLGTYADQREAEVHQKLTSLVSTGLTTIFQEDLRLVINAKQVGKRTDTEFRLLTAYGDYEVDTEILSARGGGVAAVTGFLLQTIMILLTKSPRILFLDEAFAQVSAEYEPRLADFLHELADDLGMQIVLVTHSHAYEEASEAVYRTSSKDGITSVERVK